MSRPRSANASLAGTIRPSSASNLTSASAAFLREGVPEAQPSSAAPAATIYRKAEWILNPLLMRQQHRAVRSRGEWIVPNPAGSLVDYTWKRPTSATMTKSYSMAGHETGLPEPSSPFAAAAQSRSQLSMDGSYRVPMEESRRRSLANLPTAEEVVEMQAQQRLYAAQSDLVRARRSMGLSRARLTDAAEVEAVQAELAAAEQEVAEAAVAVEETVSRRRLLAVMKRAQRAGPRAVPGIEDDKLVRTLLSAQAMAPPPPPGARLASNTLMANCTSFKEAGLAGDLPSCAPHAATAGGAAGGGAADGAAAAGPQPPSMGPGAARMAALVRLLSLRPFGHVDGASQLARRLHSAELREAVSCCHPPIHPPARHHHRRPRPHLMPRRLQLRYVGACPLVAPCASG